jgi:hypothetical protein
MNVSSSIRGRTTILVTLLFALTLIISGAALLTVLRRTMLDNIDTALALRAADLGALTASGVAPRNITIPDDGTSFAQIILDGDVIASSTNVRGQPAVDALADSLEITVRQTSGDDEVFRLLVTEQNSPAGPVTIAVGTTLADMERTIRVATWTLIVAGLALLTLAGAATWAVVRRALRPVDAMRAEVADITVGGLDRRVSQPATDDEIRLHHERHARTHRGGHPSPARLRERGITRIANPDRRHPPRARDCTSVRCSELARRR